MDSPIANPLSRSSFQDKNYQPLRNYLRYWYLFLLGAIVAVVAANFYLRYRAVPKYVMSSSLLIKDDNSQPNISAISTFGEVRTTNQVKNINDEIQVLRSKSLMQQVVNALSLNVDYQLEEKFRNREIYGAELPITLLISRLDSTQFGLPFRIHIESDRSFKLTEPSGKTLTGTFGKLIRRPYGEFTLLTSPTFNVNQLAAHKNLLMTFVDTEKLAEQYDRVLTVLPVNKDANVLTLTLTDSSPRRGEDILNKLMELYRTESLKEKNRTAAGTIAFIDERLKRITATLNGVDRNVEDYKRQNEVNDVNAHATKYLEQASDYNKKLSDWAIQIDILKSIEEYLKSDENQYKMVPSTLGLQDQTLLDLITKFNALQLDRERMLHTAQTNNPLVQNMNEQLGNLRMNIIENLRNIKNGLELTSQNLQATSGQFKDKIKQVPSIERELSEINRQQATKQNIYLYLLQKREESALALAATAANSKVIDPATTSDTPISPSRNLVYLFALMIGLGLPFMLIYVRSNINDKIQSRQDVERLTTTPILGELVHNKHNTVVVTEGNQSPLAEQFGLIRARLNALSAQQPNAVILITSSRSGEGKTFCSINIGASLALAGKKVVVLELDFRAPNLLQEVGLSESVGLVDYLTSDDVSIGDIILPVGTVPNLFVVDSGSRAITPAELMMSPKLSYLINELKVSFDHIIIDTAPIGQVADAYSLGSIVDTTIYVMRYNYTLKKQVELVNSIEQSKILPPPLIVLNDARKQNIGEYGYGYGYNPTKKKKKARIN